MDLRFNAFTLASRRENRHKLIVFSADPVGALATSEPSAISALD